MTVTTEWITRWGKVWH